MGEGRRGLGNGGLIRKTDGEGCVVHCRFEVAMGWAEFGNRELRMLNGLGPIWKQRRGENVERAGPNYVA